MKNVNYFLIIRNITIIGISLLVICFLLQTAKYYKINDDTGMTNIIINNKNVTSSLKREIIIKNNVIFLSQQDIANFFDSDIYYEPIEKRIVTTSSSKVASLLIDDCNITINNNAITLNSSAFQNDDEYQTIYLPFSELKEVYNVDINYHKDSDIIVIDSLLKEQVTANVIKNVSVKSHPRTLSRTITKLTNSDSFIFISSSKGWSKIRTEDGIIGYIKDKYISNKTTVREAFVETSSVEGKISLVWDYYSKYASAPDRTGTKINGINVVSPTLFELKKAGQGEIIDKAGENGKKYIQWAKNNDYKVWGLVSNESLIDTTGEIINNYYLRTILINNIVELAEKYNLDGINIDFEYIYKKDKDMFSQFIIELYPRLKEKNLILSVDVTAPDGSANWSECYDRLTIGRNCDYVIFMAYDQYGDSSTKPGPTAGYNWVETNVNKFLTSGSINEVPAEKLILGIPFYTKIWTQDSSGQIIKNKGNTVPVVNMKSLYNNIPETAEITWLPDLKQNYAEWTSGEYTKKIWMEDENSIREKLLLINEKNLAGAAFWNKDREDNKIWEIIEQYLIQ